MCIFFLLVEPLYIDDLEQLLDSAMDSLKTDVGDGSTEEVKIEKCWRNVNFWC